MGRRGENIRKRKDGRWEARVIYEYDSGGKPKYRSVYGKSYAEAKDKRNALLSDVLTNKITPVSVREKKDITLQLAAEQWLQTKKDEVKESTYLHYQEILLRHIFPELGVCKISSLQTADLDEFLRRKLEHGRLDDTGGLSPKTVIDIRSILILIFEYAKHLQYCSGIDKKLFYPRACRQTTTIFSHKEQALLEEHLQNHLESPFCLGVLLVFYTGLRIGEIGALQWRDFDFVNGTISIDKTIYRIRNSNPSANSKRTKVIVTRPKTESSVRIIPLPDFILHICKTNQKLPESYVLSGTNCFVEPRLCLKKYKNLLRRTGIKDYNFHAIRHTFATRCVEEGFDIKSLSELLGHANVNTTLQRYVHPSMDMKKLQMQRLEAFHRKCNGIDSFYN